MTEPTDPAAKSSRLAAILADGLTKHLLGASSPEGTRAERRACYVQAWAAWPKLMRAMIDLQDRTMASAAEGYALDETHQAFAAKRETPPLAERERAA